MADRLEDLLRDCTVRVTGGPMMGAGFFAAPGMVVTCVHVVGAGGDLQVHWERDGRPVQVAKVMPRIMRLADRGRPIPALEADYPDIAVLRISGLDGHPCVDVDMAWPAQLDSFLVFGYPREGGAIRLTPARLIYRGMNGTLPTAYLDLASDTIKPGMSGAAVLNLRTGAVCGVVVASKNAARPDGALAIHWSAVTEDIGEVLVANRDFQSTDLRWREAYRDSRTAAESEAPAAQQARLQSYLSAARAAARQHPYTIAGAPALSTVYLRQQLGVQVDQAGVGGAVPGREPADGPSRYKDPNTGVAVDVIREALQRFDIDDVLQRNDGALIVGAPGSGKSSLMRHLIEVSADSWLMAGRPEFVPALVHARVLLGSLPINKAIAGALRQDLGTRLDDIDLDALFAKPPMPGLPWLILLDGLDEIFEPERRQQVIDIIKRWWGDPRYRFLITSRPLPERELYLLRMVGIPTFEIQAFADDQLPELARRWFHALAVPRADEVVDLFIAQVRRARMAHLARNPLIATISCVVFANHPDRELPYSRADLYEAFITLFLKKVFAQQEFLSFVKERVGVYGPQGPQAVDALAADLRTLIQDLAVSRFTGSELSLRANAEQLAARYRPPAVPQSAWKQVVGELLPQSGLISERAGDLVFNHETIIEYLAACARTMPSRSRRPGARERWRLVTRAGSNESYALFVVALLRGRGTDLTERRPAVLQARKLLHARLVATVVHDGCAVKQEVVTAATRCLTKIATEKTTGIPAVLRRGIWWDDDCVMAAKALTLIDKNQGLDLLFTLAADPTVPSFSVFDVLAETMVMEDLTEIDSARGLSVLYRMASVPSAAGVEQQIWDSFNRMMIVDLILDRDLKLGADLLRPDSASSAVSSFWLVLLILVCLVPAAGRADGPVDAPGSLCAAFLRVWAGEPGGLGRGAGARDRAGQAGAGRDRSRVRISGSRLCPGGRRSTRWRAWRVSRPGTAMSRHRKVAIMALPPRTPCPARMSSPAVRAVSWCSQAAMLAASSAPHIQAMFTCGYPDGRCRRAAPSLLSRKRFSMLVRCRYQCSAATALPGAVTSRFVRMNE
jgi:hypothetical protein